MDLAEIVEQIHLAVEHAESGFTGIADLEHELGAPDDRSCGRGSDRQGGRLVAMKEIEQPSAQAETCALFLGTRNLDQAELP